MLCFHAVKIQASSRGFIIYLSCGELWDHPDDVATRGHLANETGESMLGLEFISHTIMSVAALTHAHTA